MDDHSVEIQLFFFGSALLSGLEAMKERHWRAYVLWGITALGVVCGIFWSAIKAWSPPVTAFMTKIAVNPESWFTLLVLGLLWIVVSGRSKVVPASQSEKDQGGSNDARFDGIETRFRDLYGKINAITIRLQAEEPFAQTMISEFAKDLEKKIYKADANSTKLFAGIVSDLEKADKEIMNHLEDVHNNHIQSKDFISSQIMNIVKHMNYDSRDLNYLLMYAYRNLDVMLIDLIIDAYPKGGSVLELQSDETRKARSSELQQYILKARSDLLNSWLSDLIPQLLKDAEIEAERKLKLVPKNERPADSDPLDLLRYVISETQAQWLAISLASQREEIKKGLRGQRENIEILLRERQDPMRASVPLPQ